MKRSLLGINSFSQDENRVNGGRAGQKGRMNDNETRTQKKKTALEENGEFWPNRIGLEIVL